MINNSIYADSGTCYDLPVETELEIINSVIEQKRKLKFYPGISCINAQISDDERNLEIKVESLDRLKDDLLFYMVLNSSNKWDVKDAILI